MDAVAPSRSHFVRVEVANSSSQPWLGFAQVGAGRGCGLGKEAIKRRGQVGPFVFGGKE